jgi:hypothetical protein
MTPQTKSYWRLAISMIDELGARLYAPRVLEHYGELRAQGCSEAALALLALCRRPRDGRFAEDVAAAADYVGICEELVAALACGVAP